MSRDEQSAEGWEIVDGAHEKVLEAILTRNGEGFLSQMHLYTQYIASLKGELQDKEKKVERLESALFNLPEQEGKAFLESRDKYLRNLVDAYFRAAQSKEGLMSYLDGASLCGREKKSELECYFNSLSDHASVNLLESKVMSLKGMLEDGSYNVPVDGLPFIKGAIDKIAAIKKEYPYNVARILQEMIRIVEELSSTIEQDFSFIREYFQSNSSEIKIVRSLSPADVNSFCTEKFSTAKAKSKPQLCGSQAMPDSVVEKSKQYIQLTGDWGDIENILFEGQAKEYTDCRALPYTHAEFKASISKDIAERGVFFLGEGATAEQLESVKNDYLEHSVFSDENFEAALLTIQSERNQGDEDGRGLLQWMGLGVGLGMGLPISKVVRMHDLGWEEIGVRILSGSSCYLTTAGNPAGISWAQNKTDFSSLIVAQTHYQEGVCEREKRRSTILFPVHCLKVDQAGFQALLVQYPSVRRVDYECLAAVDLDFIGETGLQEAFRQSAQAFCTDSGEFRLTGNYHVKHKFAAPVRCEPTEEGGGAPRP